jgi:hypothetical protein
MVKKMGFVNISYLIYAYGNGGGATGGGATAGGPKKLGHPHCGAGTASTTPSTPIKIKPKNLL